jgi:hypothetical protein
MCMTPPYYLYGPFYTKKSKSNDTFYELIGSDNKC